MFFVIEKVRHGLFLIVLLFAFRAAIVVTATDLVFSLQPQLMAQVPPLSSGNINCEVVYDYVTSNPEQSSVNSHVTASISITSKELSSLPAVPPLLEAPNGTKEMSQPDFHGTLTVPAETKDGEVSVTYDGNFTQIIVEKKLRPLGTIIILTPDTWWPTGTKIFDIYTAAIPDKHLRALWSCPPLSEAKSVIAKRYFSISVQVYEFQHAIRSAIFTGVKSVQYKSSSMSSSTNSGANWSTSSSMSSGVSWGSKTQISGARISSKDTPWIGDDVYQLKCAAIKIKE
jgi:hypothetical protein